MNDDAEFLATSGQYADVLRRRRKVLLAGALASLVLALLALGLGGGAGNLREAEAAVEVRPVTANRFGTNTRTRDLVSMATEVEVMRSSLVAERVVERLDLDNDPEDLLEHLVVENPPDTLVLILHYTSGSGDVARTRAQAFAEEYLAFRAATARSTIADAITQVRDELDTGAAELAQLTLDQQVATGLERANLEVQINLLNQRLNSLQAQIAELQAIFVDPGVVVTEARLVSEVTAPGWVTAFGLLGLGLIGSLGAAVVVDRLDERPRDETEVQFSVHAPVYGIQPSTPSEDKSSSGIRAAKARRMLGEYRRLRLRLESIPGSVTNWMVATPIDDGAAGEVAINLARVVAQGKESAVVVWNEDVRRAALEEIGVKLTSSLDEVLRGDRSVRDVVRPVPGIEGMAIVGLSVGQTGASSAEALREIYRELANQYDTVITVAPSSSAADTVELSTFTQGSIVAVDAQRASRAAVRRLSQSLEAVDTPVLAAFVTRSRPWW